MPMMTDDDLAEANLVPDPGASNVTLGWALTAVGLVGVGVGTWLYVGGDGADTSAQLDIGTTGDGAFVRWRMGW